MLYVPPIGGDADDPYIDGNPSAAIEGSPVPAAAIEHPMREIMAVITGAGLTPDGGTLTQLYQAIQQMVIGAQKAVIISNATFEASVANGEAVRWDAGNNRFDEAIADGTANNRAVGVADVTNAKVYIYGECPLFAGLTPGARYFLDAATPGAVTTVAPADGVAIGIAKSATTLFVDPDALGVRADLANNWSKAQSGTCIPLPALTGTLNFDFTAANSHGVATDIVTGDTIMGNGYTGPGIGKTTTFDITIKQAVAPPLRNWAYASNWRYVGGSAGIPGQTQTLGATDRIIGQVMSDGYIDFYVRSDVKS